MLDDYFLSLLVVLRTHRIDRNSSAYFENNIFSIISLAQVVIITNHEEKFCYLSIGVRPFFNDSEDTFNFPSGWLPDVLNVDQLRWFTLLYSRIFEYVDDLKAHLSICRLIRP